MPANPFQDLIPKRNNPFADLIPDNPSADPVPEVPFVTPGEPQPFVLPPAEPGEEPQFIFPGQQPRRPQQSPSALPGANLESENFLGRIIETAFRKGKEAIGEIGLEKETTREIEGDVQKVFGKGVAGKTASNLVKGAGHIIGGAFETIGGVVETGLATVGQIMIEAGASETTARKLMRDLMGLLISSMGAGAAAPATAGARTARLVSAKPKKSVGQIFAERIGGNKQDAAARAIDNALESARLKIGDPGILTQASNLKFHERLFTDALDSLAPVKKALTQAREKLSSAPDLDPFVDMRLLNGLRGVLRAVHERGTIARAERDGFMPGRFVGRPDKFVPYKKGDIIFNGKGLNDILKPLKGKLDRAMLYFAGKRAQELKAQGREKLFTRKEIDAMLNAGDDVPLFERAFREYQGFNDRILNFAQQSGLLSKESKAAIRELNQSYVPFLRVLEEGGIRRSRRDIFHPLKGSEANVGDILENMVTNIGVLMEASLRNQALSKVLQTIERAGLDTYAKRVVKGDAAAIKAVEREAAANLKKAGADPKLAERAAGLFARKPKDNTLQIFENGERVLFEIRDPYLLKSLQNVGPQGMGLAMRILSAPKKVATAGVTLSPDFIIRNFIRDTQQAFLLSKGRGLNHFIPLVSSLRGMRTRLLKDDDYYLNLANGGGFATTYKGDVQASARLKSRYAAAGIKPQNVLDTPKKIWDTLVEFSSSFEEASRLAEFRALREQGGSLRQAAAGAREVATDFAIRGADPFFRFFASTVPFLNARAQGLVRIGRQFKDDPATTAVKGLTALTIPTLALYAKNKDNPEYRALPDWIKDLYWVIFTDDQIYLIPKGFEAGALFGTIPERMFEAIEKQHGKRFADALLRAAQDTFSFNPIPQIVKPPFDVARNRNFFGGRIVPADLQRVSAEEQFRPDTSDTLVEAARVLKETTGVGMSPMQAEAVVRGYLGTLGVYALDVADSLVRKATGNRNPTKRMDEIPLVKSFVRSRPLRRTSFEEDFYDLLGEARTLDATLTKILKEGRKPTIEESEKTTLKMLPALEKLARTASTLNAQIRLIKGSQEFSAKKKRELIDERLRARNQLFERVLNALPKDVVDEYGITQTEE